MTKESRLMLHNLQQLQLAQVQELARTRKAIAAIEGTKRTYRRKRAKKVLIASAPKPAVVKLVKGKKKRPSSLSRKLKAYWASPIGVARRAAMKAAAEK